MYSSFLLCSGYTTRVFYIRLFPEGIGLRVDRILAFQVGGYIGNKSLTGASHEQLPRGREFDIKQNCQGA